MAKVTTHVDDPLITIEHWFHRTDDGSHTYSTHTGVTTDHDIEEALAIAADLATRADTIARQELIRRMSRDVQETVETEEAETWSALREIKKDHKIG